MIGVSNLCLCCVYLALISLCIAQFPIIIRDMCCFVAWVHASFKESTKISKVGWLGR